MSNYRWFEIVLHICMRITSKRSHTCYTFMMTNQASLKCVFKLIGTPLLLMHHTHRNTHTITMDSSNNNSYKAVHNKSAIHNKSWPSMSDFIEWTLSNIHMIAMPSIHIQCFLRSAIYVTPNGAHRLLTYENCGCALRIRVCPCLWPLQYILWPLSKYYALGFALQK